MEEKAKTPVVGVVQRNGEAKAKVVDKAHTGNIIENIAGNVEFDSRLISDENQIYKKTTRLELLHDSINHSKKEYGRGDVYTNTLEGF
jgi:hypothetical protein